MKQAVDWLLAAEWRFLLMVGAVIVAIVAIFAGFVEGEVKRVLDDPAVREMQERERVERERKQAWKDHWKK